MTDQHIPEPEVTKGTFQEGKDAADKAFDENPGTPNPYRGVVPNDFKSGFDQRWIKRTVQWDEENPESN